MPRNYLTKDDRAKQLLSRLAAKDTSVGEYREAFYALGEFLGEQLQECIEPTRKVMLACAWEDADFLVRGIRNKLHTDGTAVFWQKRIKTAAGDIAPITSSYIDGMDRCDTLVVVKSIISSSCVVKSQLNYLIERMAPTKIIIVAPVRYEQAEPNLKKEFPLFISERFQYLSLAVDSDLGEGNIVIPGIGGDVAVRLGLKEYVAENGAVPLSMR